MSLNEFRHKLEDNVRQKMSFYKIIDAAALPMVYEKIVFIQRKKCKFFASQLEQIIRRQTFGLDCIRNALCITAKDIKVRNKRTYPYTNKSLTSPNCVSNIRYSISL